MRLLQQKAPTIRLPSSTQKKTSSNKSLSSWDSKSDTEKEWSYAYFLHGIKKLKPESMPEETPKTKKLNTKGEILENITSWIGKRPVADKETLRMYFLSRINELETNEDKPESVMLYRSGGVSISGGSGDLEPPPAYTQ